MEKQDHVHVAILPLPAVGHVNSMLNLAELLGHAGIKITFLNTEHYYDRVIRHSSDAFSRYMQIPGFQFKTITDGLPRDHPRTPDKFPELVDSLNCATPPLLKEMVSDSNSPVNCIITDGYMSRAIDAAREVGISIIYFRTISACAFWSFHCIPDIIDAGELPIKGTEDMDRLITTVPGMEGFLRCRDLPSFCRVNDPMDPQLLLFARETRLSAHADGLILNTFEDLEGPILSQIRNHSCPNIYSIGPLNAHLKVRIPEKTYSSSSLWKIDRSCMAWLDKQPKQSVIYVSFGSIAVMSRDQLIEFYYGLVHSKKSFLWVIRPDLISGKDGENQIPEELLEATKERGYIAGWVPQEEVLAHSAVGGFLTHCGWNSTLESIVAGMPMICWPSFADQQTNSRFVGEVWKLGLDIKDLCDRNIVEKAVNDLMVERKEEFMESADRMANLAKKSVNKGGSSYCNLDRLVNDIKMMSSQPQNC
ncbi:hypothetical protein WN944_017900 [Citrus x changshan-huyou]|uniref:UDP-glycosyltransferase 85A2 n=2 Tax=Citrus TaxID=2706 RepID=A0ACB8L015_CITSI|nr:UDP-glycosyltransferase 85A2 [Citrus sinensis]